MEHRIIRDHARMAGRDILGIAQGVQDADNVAVFVVAFALQVDEAVAAADPQPLRSPVNPTRVTAERMALVASRHFVLERVHLQKASSWALVAEPETWILVLDGQAAIGLTTVSIGQAIFVGGDRSSIEVGADGLTALIAYPASRPIVSLLQRLCEPSTQLLQPTAPDDPNWTVPAGART